MKQGIVGNMVSSIKKTYRTKNQTKYSMRGDAISSSIEIKEINDCRKSMGLPTLMLVNRVCLRCLTKIEVFKPSSVWMCKSCRNSSESKSGDNYDY